MESPLTLLILMAMQALTMSTYPYGIMLQPLSIGQ